MIKAITKIKNSVKLQSFFTFLAMCLLLVIALYVDRTIGLKIMLTQFLSLLILFILFILIIWWWSNRKDKQLYSKSKQHAQTSIETFAKSRINQKMKRAIAFMRSTSTKSGLFKFVAQNQLPWFMLMGKSFAGKSTLLQNSKVHFPFTTYSKNDDDNDLIGLSQIEFWFANHAVFIDTQRCDCGDNQQNSLWLYILKYLSKYQNQSLLKGIIYVIDANNVLHEDANKIQNEISQLRREVVYVSQILGYFVPIYLVINKIDHLLGFLSFMQLSPTRQQDIWGIDVNDVNNITSQLQKVCLHFSNQVIDKLSQQLNSADKIDLLNLNESFRLFIDKLNAFILLATKENPYQITPQYRGVYITSAINSYGITELLSTKLLENKVAIEKTRTNIHNFIWSRVLSICLGGVLVISALICYGKAYSINTNILKNALTLSSQAVIDTNTLVSANSNSLSQLYNLYFFYIQLADYSHYYAWYQRLGLYKGNYIINDVKQIILKQVILFILKPINFRLVNNLQYDTKQWQQLNSQQRRELRSNYYAILKAYLMLHYPQRLDVNYFDQVLTHLSLQDNIYTINDDSTLEMINFYLTQLKQMNGEVASISNRVNTNLVTIARVQLNTNSMLDNIYAQLRDNGLLELGVVSLQDLLKTDDKTIYITQSQLSRLYTKEGWQQYMLPQIMKLSSTNLQQDDWVLDMPITHEVILQNEQQYSTADRVNQQFIRQLQLLYFNDYMCAWTDFLNSIQIQKFSSLDDAANKVLILSQQESVTDKLYKSIIFNLSVVTHAQSSDDALRNNYLQSLEAIHSELEPLLVSADTQRDSLLLAKQIMSGSAIDAAIYHASLICKQNVELIPDVKLKQAFLHILLLPLQETWRNVLQSAKQDLELQWQTNIISVYQQTLLHKAPFTNSSDEVSSEDVMNFFNPINGLFSLFVKQQLSPFLMYGVQGWTEKTWLNYGLGLSKYFLQVLSHVQNIGNDLFDISNDKPGLIINLYPNPTPNVDEISLTLNGQEYRYRNEPQRWQQINWQAQDISGNAILKIIIANNTNPQIIEFDSVWGIFQLFHRAEIKKIANSTYRLTWQFKDEHERPIKVSCLIKMVNHKDFIDDIILQQLIVPNNF